MSCSYDCCVIHECTPLHPSPTGSSLRTPSGQDEFPGEQTWLRAITEKTRPEKKRKIGAFSGIASPSPFGYSFSKPLPNATPQQNLIAYCPVVCSPGDKSCCSFSPFSRQNVSFRLAIAVFANLTLRKRTWSSAIFMMW